MNETQITPAPELPFGGLSPSKWEVEHSAFLRMKHTLLTTHKDKFVAVHEQRLVGSGDDQIEVAMEAYRQFGYQPIFVGLVCEREPRQIRIASPRLHGTANE